MCEENTFSIYIKIDQRFFLVHVFHKNLPILVYKMYMTVFRIYFRLYLRLTFFYIYTLFFQSLSISSTRRDAT